MMSLQIDSINGYKPRPDFSLRIQEDGRVTYKGRYYVGITGTKSKSIGQPALREIQLLSDFLMKRNQKNYLKKNMVPSFAVKTTTNVTTQYQIDEKDVVSEDIITQIIELTGAGEWIDSNLDLYLIMSKQTIKTKELAVIRAIDTEQAILMYLDDRRSRSFRSVNDYIGMRMGYQKSGSIVNPAIYFSFSDHQIQEHSSSLLLNQGPKLNVQNLEVFLFLTFGKRYNDPGASYFLVLGKDKQTAYQLFQSTYPHFMPRDFQQVDLGVNYSPIPFVETHIPIAIR